MSSGLGDPVDVEGRPCVSVGHRRAPVSIPVLALSRCSYKSVGEQRRVSLVLASSAPPPPLLRLARLGRGASCKCWPLCILVKRGKFISMVCGHCPGFCSWRLNIRRQIVGLTGVSQADFSQLRSVVSCDSALSGSASLELQHETAPASSMRQCQVGL